MTGATAGIGAVALTHLALPGTRIIIGARATSAPPAVAGAEVIPLELSSLASVRTFAARVLDELAGDPIDMLVLNAGSTFRNRSARSADGFELTFAVNHLSHYLLARLLLPAVADGSRIVITTSDTHDPTLMPGGPKRLDVDGWATGTASRIGAYPASKLANLLTAESLSRLPTVIERHISVVAYNPGFTPGTGLLGRTPGPVRTMIRHARPLSRLVSRFSPVFYIGTVEAAGEALAGLVDGSITPPAGHIYASIARGELTYPDPSALARDPDARDEMWKRSAEFVGLPVD
jgi:NAD(P)-dependent dehydrogenase (short-subunit alcohol dehydrogenase family)